MFQYCFLYLLCMNSSQECYGRAPGAEGEPVLCQNLWSLLPGVEQDGLGGVPGHALQLERGHTSHRQGRVGLQVGPAGVQLLSDLSESSTRMAMDCWANRISGSSQFCLLLNFEKLTTFQTSCGCHHRPRHGCPGRGHETEGRQERHQVSNWTFRAFILPQ